MEQAHREKEKIGKESSGGNECFGAIKDQLHL